MGLVFSWLWDKREESPPLLVVTTETQVSLNPPTQYKVLLSVTCYTIVCVLRQRVRLMLRLNIVYPFAPSVLLQTSTPPPSVPHSFPSLVYSFSLITLLPSHHLLLCLSFHPTLASPFHFCLRPTPMGPMGI